MILGKFMKRPVAVFIIFMICALAAALFWLRVSHYLPLSLWYAALVTPRPDSIGGLIFLYNDLPRLAMAGICGAGLAFSGVVSQQMLRNPLAEPMTLGIASGSYLVLSLVTVFFPALFIVGREWIAFAGGGLALCFVMLIALRQRTSGVSLILAGMILNLCCSAVGVILAILYFRQLSFMALWGGGSLAQYDWRSTTQLFLHLLPCIGFCLLFARPMGIYGTGDVQAKNLGISVPWLLAATMGSVLLITALIVSSVGIIGFVGLGAPHLARLAGARRLRDRLLWASVLGMVLLWLADELARRLSGLSGLMIPVGAVTALLGAPVILGYLSRAKTSVIPRETRVLPAMTVPAEKKKSPLALLTSNLVCLLVLSLVFLVLGKGLHGWQLEFPWHSTSRVSLRLIQLTAAISVGVLLAIAGGIIQNLSGNTMASPDLLGITAGGALGIIATLFLSPANTGNIVIGCALGCGAVLLLLLLLGRRSHYAPETLLLAGVSLTLILQAVSTVVMASGDLRVMQLFSLLIGSTYSVRPHQAEIVLLAAIALVAILPLIQRWLVILPLGTQVAYGLGINIRFARLVLWLLSASATAMATMIVGPLSFIGLVAPHMARMQGADKPLPFLLTSASFGALLMLAADWIGRWMLFPREIATGAIASLTGGIYLVIIMLRGRRAA